MLSVSEGSAGGKERCVRQVERSLTNFLRLTQLKILKSVSEYRRSQICDLRTEKGPKNFVSSLVNPGPGYHFTQNLHYRLSQGF